MQLIAITETGAPAGAVGTLPGIAAGVLAATAGLYRNIGFAPPWIGYLAIENGACVGTCAFKAPPEDGRVEIAYFTFPAYEGRGVATRMAEALRRIAFAADPRITLVAQTLPEENASTRILRKLGFHCIGQVQHPDDGAVWEWQQHGSEFLRAAHPVATRQ